ncbi:hypothetical protein D915_010175, partial [Fasciola hepatica]
KSSFGDRSVFHVPNSACFSPSSEKLLPPIPLDLTHLSQIPNGTYMSTALPMNISSDHSCTLCGKLVTTKHGMARHMRIVHQGVFVTLVHFVFLCSKFLALKQCPVSFIVPHSTINSIQSTY